MVQLLSSSAMTTPLREATEMGPAIQMKDVDTEQTCRPQDTKPQETSTANITLLRNNNTELSVPNDDRRASLCASNLLERDTEGTLSQETSNHSSALLTATEQALVIDVEVQGVLSRDKSLSSEKGDHANCNPSKKDDHVQHALELNAVELEETILHRHSNRMEDIAVHTIQQMKGRVSKETTAQISSPTDGGEHTADDMEQASHMTNMGSQEMCTQTSSSSQTISKVPSFPRNNLEPERVVTRSLSMIELSLNRHSQQDAAKEEAAMRSFIMHRFLPAAKEVAAEHESCIASQASKSPSRAPHSLLPQQSERTIIAHHLKSRARNAPKGLTSLHLHSQHHQEDSMPQSMRSCGFLCLGLKSALFRARRTVSASISKKTTCPIHSSNNLKVADEGISVIPSETEELITNKGILEGMTECERAKNIYVPSSHPFSLSNSTRAQESPPRHAVVYDASFCRTGCPSSDGFTYVGCDPTLSHSGKAKKAGSHYENRNLKQSGQGNHLAAACIAIEERDSGAGMVEEAVAESTSSRDCMCTLETSGNKPASVSAYKSAWLDGSDDEDDETQFFDAMSRLNSVKSTASFYTFGSPRSECEVSAFQGESINDEVKFVDSPSYSVTLTSEDKLAPLDVVKGLAPKTSSLSQRVGKGLKLDTHSKRAISPTKDDPCASELKNEHQRAKLQTKSFSRQWHHSLDSMCSLYPSKVATISPVFPAKCQNNARSALGWPFGISTYQSSGGAGSPHQTRQDPSIEKYVMGGHVPSPPLPPSPTESWLGKAVNRNASKTSPLATLQQKEKQASARKKLDFISVNQEAGRRWEDVVRGSRVHQEHLRFSEELHEHCASKNHPSNLNVIKPLNL